MPSETAPPPSSTSVAPEPVRVPVSAPALVADIEVTPEDYVRDLSATDRRHELVNAFLRSEQRAGKAKDTVKNFSARFDAFATKPA